MEKTLQVANRSCGYSVLEIIDRAHDAFNQHPSGSWEDHKRYIVGQILGTDRDYDNILYHWKFCILRYPTTWRIAYGTPSKNKSVLANNSLPKKRKRKAEKSPSISPQAPISEGLFAK